MKKIFLLICLASLWLNGMCQVNITNLTVSPSIICPGATTKFIGNFSISYVTGPNTLTAVSFNAGGTYNAGDILNFKLWRTNTIAFTSPTLMSTLTTSLGSGTKTFSGLSYALPSASYYWITVDVAPFATFNHTICDSGFSPSNIVVTGVAAGGLPATSTSYQTIGGGTMVVSDGPNPMCGSGTLTLSVVATPASSSYNWSGPSGFTSATATTSIPISPAAAGVYTITAIGTGFCPYIDTTSTILYSPAAGPISGPTVVCANVPTTYTDTTGNSWSVTSGLGSIDNTTGVYTGYFTGGIDTITFTTPNGCKATLGVSVNPFPTPILGSSFVCTGHTDSLSDTSGADAGLWSSTNTSIATISTTGVVYPVAPGIVYIGYKMPVTGCGPIQTAITVGATPSFFAGGNHVCLSASLMLTDTLTGGAWSSSNPAISPINSGTGVVTGGLLGIDTITYTTPNGCYRSERFFVTAGPTPIIAPNNTCTGYTPQLVDGMPYGTWLTSNSTLATVMATDSVNGIAYCTLQGIDTISYASCGDTVRKAIIIYALPSPILGTPSVCKGDSIILHDTTFGGIWVSKDTSIAKAAAAFGIISGIRQGSDTITYVLGNGCRTSIYFAVDTFPDTITGKRFICQLDTISLSDATPSGKWTSKDTLVAIIDSNGNLKALFPGVDSIFYKNGGCKVTTTVTVNPLPTPIFGDTAICANGVIDSLKDGILGGKWVSSNTAVATIDSIHGVLTTVGTMAGASTITYTLPTGCKRTQGITLHPTPVPLIHWNFLTGEDSCQNYFVQYQWYDSSTIGLIPGAVTNYLAILYAENYYVRVVDSFGCIGNSAISNPLLSVNNNKIESEISVYPNPTSGKLFISSPVLVKAVISNAEGQIIFKQDSAKQLDMSNLTSGIYYIELFDAKMNKLTIQKIIKE